MTFLLVLAGAAVAAFLLLRGNDPPAWSPLEIEGDPYAYESGREAEFQKRAAAGHSHVVYAKSPGGVVATARRVAAFRDDIEKAAGEAGVDPDLIEGMVLLESAGRPDARASDDLEGAVGLTQILAETGTNLLHMQVDVRASERLTRRLASCARTARGRPHQGKAAPGGRALRPAEGARGHGALPEARQGRVRPRGPGGGLVPHGHRQSPAATRRLR